MNINYFHKKINLKSGIENYYFVFIKSNNLVWIIATTFIPIISIYIL